MSRRTSPELVLYPVLVGMAEEDTGGEGSLLAPPPPPRGRPELTTLRAALTLHWPRLVSELSTFLSELRRITLLWVITYIYRYR